MFENLFVRFAGVSFKDSFGTVGVLQACWCGRSVQRCSCGVSGFYDSDAGGLCVKICSFGLQVCVSKTVSAPPVLYFRHVGAVGKDVRSVWRIVAVWRIKVAETLLRTGEAIWNIGRRYAVGLWDVCTELDIRCASAPKGACRKVQRGFTI